MLCVSVCLVCEVCQCMCCACGVSGGTVGTSRLAHVNLNAYDSRVRRLTVVIRVGHQSFRRARLRSVRYRHTWCAADVFESTQSDGAHRALGCPDDYCMLYS